MPPYQPSPVRYATEKVDGLDIFYRESGDPTKPSLVLLHGFPTSSHMYREVLAQLGDDFHVIAPDYPGFGNSESPSAEDYDYRFPTIRSGGLPSRLEGGRGPFVGHRTLRA